MRVFFSFIFTLVLSVLLVLVMPVHSITGQEEEFSVRVSVSVKGDTNIREEVRRCLVSDLALLNDVEVVDTNSDWLIGIIAHELSTKFGYKTGVVFSGVVIKTSQQWLDILEGQGNEYTPELTATLYGCEGHWLRVGSHNEIEGMCHEIIKNFDQDYLEKDRKFFHRAREIRKFR